MYVKLSTQGRLIIPKPIREALGLQAGTCFEVRLTGEGEIILTPLLDSPVDALYGKYANTDLLTDLEAEHRQETTGEGSF